MRTIAILVITAVLALGGCRQGPTAGSAKTPSPDDVIGKYAKERGISREQAALNVQQEVGAARAGRVSSTAGSQFPGNGIR
jgi:hypothetical protein